MPTKNTLNLNPLPQQSDDYSRYEKSEFRWGRIIAAILAILLVIFILGYLMFSSSDEVLSESALVTNASEKNSLSEVNTQEQGTSKVPLLTSDQIEPIQVESIQVELKSTSQPLTDKLNVVNESTPETTRAQTKSKALEKEKIEAVKLAETTSSSIVQTVASSQMKPASVLIVNSAITRANLSLSIINDEPGKILNHSVVMPQDGIIKVILFTEMSDIKGRILFHEWYLNGKRQARVRIPVNVSHQKSFSSKFINRQMLGQWQVKVVDQNGEPYILADFEVISS